MSIPRSEVNNRLREADFHYKDRGDRAEIYRQSGTRRRVDVSMRDWLEEDYVIVVLRQAGLTENQIDGFLRSATKKETKKE